MLMSRRSVLWLAASMILCGMLATDGFAKKGGNGGGGGGGEDPPQAALPNVEFDLRFLPLRDGSSAAVIADMNIGLEVVGHLQTDLGDQGFLYDYRSDLLVTLDELISAGEWQAMLDGDWTQSRLEGINSWGLVVGYLMNSDRTDARSFILDTRKTPALVHYPDVEVPGFAGAEKTLLDKVNIWGDIVGHLKFPGSDYTPVVFNPGIQDPDYEVPTIEVREIGLRGEFNSTPYNTEKLTDSRRVLVRGSQGEAAAEYDIEMRELVTVSTADDGLYIQGIHKSGQFFGEQTFKGGKWGIPRPTIVDWVDGHWQVVWQQSVEGQVTAINDSSEEDNLNEIFQGDILTREVEGSGFNNYVDLYLHNPRYGKILLDDLIRPDQLNAWQAIRYDDQIMTEKLPDSNFGAIADYFNWILVPHPHVRN